MASSIPNLPVLGSSAPAWPPEDREQRIARLNEKAKRLPKDPGV